ncbi:MAG: hypothetical protein KIT85_20135 [Pseudolabrys sp.]|nr:hypothetical protein [Pseudolabrys sp.]
MLGKKFEWQFKQCNEQTVKTPRPRQTKHAEIMRFYGLFRERRCVIKRLLTLTVQLALTLFGTAAGAITLPSRPLDQPDGAKAPERTTHPGTREQ